MSHFICRCICVLYFGTPNGHALTQLRQSRQRGFNADITTPSSETLIASAGQTKAHVGSLQSWTPSASSPLSPPDRGNRRRSSSSLCVWHTRDKRQHRRGSRCNVADR